MKALYSSKDAKAIRHNILIHDRIAPHYDKIHIEIHNPTEQRRVNQSLHNAILFTNTNSKDVFALDYGAGTGNISNHLLSFGCHVIAADVSSVSLQRTAVKLERFDKLQTQILNGNDLSNFKDNTFDLITTYSVLHHVPDYLAMIDEFVRVTKPGGVIYIDHEACHAYWKVNNVYLNYLEDLGNSFRQAYLLILELPDDRISYWANAIIRFKRALAKGSLTGSILRKLNIIYEEGDIHITKEDHIEWDDIVERLKPSCEILFDQDYLVCREADDTAPVWSKWQNKTTDMRLIIARKKTVSAA